MEMDSVKLWLSESRKHAFNKPNLVICLNILEQYTGCFKNSFTTLKANINLVIEDMQCFELSQCSKTHRILSGIVTVQSDFNW
jgi:hypothetical protein